MKQNKKKIMKISLIIIGLLISILLIWGAWVALKINKIQQVEEFSTMAELDTMVTDLVAQENIPGMAVAIVAHGDVVWAEGYGYANLQNKQPVTADTTFLIASVSKLFTGVGVMKAWEDGYLSLDADIDDYLSFPVDNPRLNDEVITLRHLATHTSGINDNLRTFGKMSTQGDPDVTLHQYLQAYLLPQGELYNAKGNFTDHAPGDGWSYSNVGAALAAELVEASTGTELDTYTQDLIFTPLGMENTGWHLSDFENVDDIAVPYNFGAWPWVYGAEVAYSVSYNDEPDNSFWGKHGFEHYAGPSYPDGGLRSSVNDTARFLAAIMNGGQLDGVEILDEATITMMFEPQFSSLEKDFETDEQALFWVYDDGLLGHAGGDPGVTSIMVFDPESEVGTVIILNRGTDPIAVAVRQRVLHQIMDNSEQINELFTNETQ